MKSRMLILALFVATVAAVILYPAQRGGAYPDRPVVDVPLVDRTGNRQPRIEVVFVLDTTGSMGGLIAAAKEKIWSIASSMAQAEPTPEIRMGLVAYRDRGDDYVTRVVDLSDDLDTMYAVLMGFQAAGGGDGPESVNQALYDAVHRVSWSQDPDTYRTIFLVGDAPPHLDYPNDVQYPEILATARDRDILVNTVQCGSNQSTHGEWTRIAQLAGGSYFRVDQSGGALAMETPFDRQIASLSKALDETRLYYGSDADKARQRAKFEAADKLHREAVTGSRVRRAVFNATEAGRKNFLGDKELVDDVASGRVELDAIAPATLPEPLQAMAPEERRAVVTEAAQRRDALKRQIGELSAQREAFIREKVAEKGGAEESLDYKVYSAIREQAESKGLEFEAEPDY